MTVDYHALNRQTKKDVYPLPRINDLLDELAHARFLSAIGLESGYHQVGLTKDAQEKTAFVTRYGLFEYTVLPLGLCNAPSTFQRVMNSVMGEYIDDFVLVYLDDILVFSSTEYEHENHLRLVFQQLRQHKLQAKLKKCEFGKPRVKSLGHIVGLGKVHMDKDKVAAVINWEPPRDVKGVQQFLGFANYYNRFIPNFAKVAAPISNLLSNQKEFKWDTQ